MTESSPISLTCLSDITGLGHPVTFTGVNDITGLGHKVDLIGITAVSHGVASTFRCVIR